jgi:Flp pilus assembly protein TadG
MKHSEKGQSLMEFALCLPLLVLIVFGIIEFGITLNNYEEESNAVSVAARLLSSSRGQTADPCALVAQAIEGPGETGVGGAAPGLNPTNLTLTVTLNGNQYSGNTCTSGAAQLVSDTPAQVQVTYPCSLALVLPGFSTCTLSEQNSEVIQ